MLVISRGLDCREGEDTRGRPQTTHLSTHGLRSCYCFHHHRHARHALRASITQPHRGRSAGPSALNRIHRKLTAAANTLVAHNAAEQGITLTVDEMTGSLNPMDEVDEGQSMLWPFVAVTLGRRIAVSAEKQSSGRRARTVVALAASDAPGALVARPRALVTSMPLPVADFSSRSMPMPVGEGGKINARCNC